MHTKQLAAALGGRALVAKRGRKYMRTIGRRGAELRWRVHNIFKAERVVSAAKLRNLNQSWHLLSECEKQSIYEEVMTAIAKKNKTAVNREVLTAAYNEHTLLKGVPARY